jgi:hypothetical protein
MESDKARAFWMDLYAWARINVFCMGIMFLVGWTCGVYRVNLNFYQSVSADDMFAWDMEKQDIAQSNQSKNSAKASGR